MTRCWFILVVFASTPPLALGAETTQPMLKIGVKDFKESAILAEMVAQLARHAGADCTTSPPAKSSQVWTSLRKGNIEAYIAYTGTLKLFLPGVRDLEKELETLGIQMIPLGFENNYALGMRRKQAQQKNIRSISDLAKPEHKDLTFGFDEEFLRRKDGWEGLRKKYQLKQSPTLIEHSQVYHELHDGKVDLIDCFTTDGALREDSTSIQLLEDDQDFFSTYEAVLLVRAKEVPSKVLKQWRKLEGKITQSAMRIMNAQVNPRKLEHEVAAQFLDKELKISIRPQEPQVSEQVPKNLKDRYVRIGAKSFPESLILAEMAAHLVRRTGARCSVIDFGETELVWNALKRGEIDLYPEYTGTLREFLLYGVRDLEPVLHQYGIRSSKSLGFRNDFALGMLESTAAKHKITKISDLLNEDNQTLKFAFSLEFLNRKDGWPGLQRVYPVTQKPTALKHEQAYKALTEGTIHVMDVYTTDGELHGNKVRVLKDDRGYFARYDAILLYRPARVSSSVLNEVLGGMEGKIDEQAMQEMNYRVEHDGISEKKVAAEFLDHKEPAVLGKVLRHTGEHLLLVLVSLTAVAIVGVPLGILAARLDGSWQIIRGTLGTVNLMFSLVVLVFVVPFLETLPVLAIEIMAVFTFLPTILGTYTGFNRTPATSQKHEDDSPPSFGGRLLGALPSILTGIQKSAVFCVALGTLGPSIGLGGYGQDILEGARTRDTSLLLHGALPAVLLALILIGVVELLRRFVLSKEPETQTT